MKKFLLIPFLFFTVFTIYGQEKLYKVHIGEHALMCPNLGTKLKVNMKQIGAELLMFDIQTSTMVVKVDTKETPEVDEKYITTIVQLTGYPDSLVSVEEINKEKLEELLLKDKENDDKE